MAHVIRGDFHRHSRYSHNAHPDGWWKFGVVALIATVLGVVLVYSPLFRDSEPLPTVVPAAPKVVNPIIPVITLPAVTSSESLIKPPAATADRDQTVVVPPFPAEAKQPAVTAPVVAEAEQPAVPAPAAVAPLSQGIHNVDFANLPQLQALARQLNGRIDGARVQYSDLTGDGAPEAVVPITSDGTLGDLAFVVLTAKADAPQAILVRYATPGRQGLVVSFDGAQLTETSAVYGPFDANCCPSQLVRTYFRWDGSALVVDHTNTITIPQGKQAD